MHALPSVLALLAAALLAAPLLVAMRGAGLARENYRGRALPCPFGMLVPLASLLALLPVMLVQRVASTAVLEPDALPVAAYCLAVIALGFLDDRLGGVVGARAGAAPRGLRGHAAALRRGEVSTGALKAAGSIGAALLAVDALGFDGGRLLLAVAVLVLATHVFNLLDLRPGRAPKALALLATGLALGSQDVRPIWAVGLFGAPALLAGAYDLRERALLGDSGASLLGAVAGMLLVLSLSATGQAIALAVLAIATIYGELGSISALVERTPGLRELDSWGRPS
jgi:hypothetical protein